MPKFSPHGYIRTRVPLFNNIIADASVLAETHENMTLADIDYFLDGGTMQAAAYTLAHTTMPDGLARNITATRTDAAAGDTGLALVLVGTDNDGVAITETLTLTNSTTTYAGTKAFKTLTSARTASWVIGGVTADTIEIGFGTCVGLKKAAAADADILVVLCPATTALTVVGKADGTLSGTTADASAATYDGAKDMTVYYRPVHSTVFTGTGALAILTTAALGYECVVEEFGFTAYTALVGGSGAQSFTLKDSAGNVIHTLALAACAAGATTKSAETEIVWNFARIVDTGTLILSRVTGGTAFTSGSGEFYVRVRQRTQAASGGLN
jgi:hypothetical protein